MNSLDSNRCFTLEHALAEPEFEEPVSDGEEPDVNLNRRVKSRSSYARLEVQSMGIDLTRDPALEPDRDNNLEMEQPLLRVACNNRTNLTSGGGGANKGFLDYYRMLETAVRQREAHQGTDAIVHSNRQQSSEKSETEFLLGPPAPTELTPALLPDGWERHLDDDGPYYWHIRTGTIQREPPVVSPVSEVPVAVAGPTPAEVPTEPEAPAQKEAKRQSYPLGSNMAASERSMPVRFAVRSLGWSEIPEEELSPERSSRAVNRCIVDLSLGRGQALLDGVGRWGEGRDLLLELDESQLRLLSPGDAVPLHAQPLHAIRVWGVGRDNGRERDFAYVARDRNSRRFMCHVFRCDMPARIIANALRDVCKKMVVERSLSTGDDWPGPQRTASKRSALDRIAGLSLEGEPVFPCPMEEPRKVLRALYLGSVPVSGPSGMDLLNHAVDALLDRVPKAHWLPVQVAVAPSTVTVLLDSPTRRDGAEEREVLAECRVRFLSFLGIGKQVTSCGFIMHTAQDGFVAHVFHCEPSAGALCKTIEAACKLRYQKCLDAHRQSTALQKDQPQQATKGLSMTALKSVIGNISTRIVGRKGLSAVLQTQAEAS